MLSCREIADEFETDIDFLVQREADLKGLDMITMREEIRGEIKNINAAVKWAIVHWEVEASRKVLVRFFTFCAVQGWHEGKVTYERIARYTKETRSARGISSSSKDVLYLSARVHQAFFCSNLGLVDESEAISKGCLDAQGALGMRVERAQPGSQR
jgi:hypothetical protein